MKKEILSLVFSGLMFCSSQAAQSQQMPNKYLGEVFWTASYFCPLGSVMAAGQTLSISEHTAIFSLIGVFYGGDGKQTFGVPDLRGRVSISQGAGPELTAYKTGQSGGFEATTQNPRTSALGVVLTNPIPVAVAKASPDAGPAAAVNVPSFGGTGQGLPQDNRQPFLVMTACIVTDGMFPMHP